MSVFYFTLTTSETELKLKSALERVLELFQKYFGDIEHVGKYS